jgi:hypothetical protein
MVVLYFDFGMGVKQTPYAIVGTEPGFEPFLKPSLQISPLVPTSYREKYMRSPARQRRAIPGFLQS